MKDSKKETCPITTCKQDIQVISCLIKKNSEFYQEDFLPSSPLVNSAKNIFQTLKKIKTQKQKLTQKEQEDASPQKEEKKKEELSVPDLKQSILDSTEKISAFVIQKTDQTRKTASILKKIDKKIKRCRDAIEEKKE